MKKILIFGMTSGYGGIESFIMNVYRNIDHEKYQFSFVKSEDTIAYEDELLEDQVPIYRVTSRSENARQHYHDIEALFQKEKYDVVWTNRCMLNSIAELKYAKKYGCPIRIMHAHSSKNTGSTITQLLHSFNKRRLDRYCTLKFTCSGEATTYFYTSKEDVILIRNGLDVQKYLYDEDKDKAMRASFGFQKELILGHIGRFTFEKNQKFALDIFQRVHQELPDAKLLLCGKGPLFEECKAYARELGIQESVKFLGEVKNIPELLQCMDIFIFPSLFEGLPYAALEAQFSGAKCFISKHVSPEVVLCEETEVLEIEDSSLWADRILHHQDFQKIRHDELLASDFNISVTCKQIEGLLH